MSAPIRIREQPLPGRAELAVRVLQGERTRGALLHMHPGGFIHGEAAMCDASNIALAQALGLAVVSVNYRLAPAHPHPAALEDCVAAALWLMANAKAAFGSDKLLIAGESAGAALAALTLLALRDHHQAAGAFLGASFVVGGFDFSMTPSQRAATAQHFLNAERLGGTRDAAFPGRSLEQLRDASISPLYADLRGLPPAIFSAGGADSMLDDTLFMAARWRAAGNEAQLEVYAGQDHLFMTEPTALAAQAARKVEEFFDARL